MTQAMVTLAVPFDSLVETVKTLDYSDQERLLALLEVELAAAEEAMIDGNDKLRNEISEARAAYHAGDYVTLDEYKAKEQDGSA